MERILRRKHLACPSQYPEKYIIAVFGHVIRTPYTVCNCFKHRINVYDVQSYCGKRSSASRLHLQSHLSKRRTDPIWDNVNSETRTESNSQKLVQNWAVAVLCNRFLRCIERLERYPDVRTGKRDDDRNIGEQCSSSSWQQHSNTDTSYFEIDLRIQGVPDDIVQQDANRMKKTNEKLKNWRNGSRAASIREDLSREDGDQTFSEKLQRVIYEMAAWTCSNSEKLQRPFTTSLFFSSTCWRKCAFRMWLLSTSKRRLNQQN